ncbi:meiosis-specific nuclear structural protein 1 [Marchantia polymorpha subsp. ruderalis]
MAYLHTKPSVVGLSFRDAHMVKNRINEYETQKLSHWVKDHGLAKMRGEFLERADNNALARKEAAHETAEIKNEMLDRRAQERKHAILKREDDEQLANFLEEEKRQLQRDKLILEAMKEKSPEIRLLKRYLEIAKMNKERYTQSQEKEFFEMKEAERNAVFHDLLMETYNKLSRKEQERLDKIAEDKIETKRRLDIQMKEKVWAAEKAAREKQHDADVVQMVHEKELRQEAQEQKIRRDNVRMLQDYIKQYLMEKEELDRENELRRQREDQDILDHQARVEARMKEQEEKARIQKAFKDKIYGMLMEGQEDALRERDEMEQALNDLYFEQAEEEYRKKAEALRIHREHMKANMRAASDQYWALKKHRYEQMKLEKAEWAKKMMEQVMEMNRFDQMSAYKQRMKKVEYRRQIDAQWEEMQYLLAKEAAEEKAKRKKEKAEYALQEALLEQERQKILKDCAEELARFFPKGVCRNQDDLRMVGLPAKDRPVMKEPIPHRLPTL